MSNTRTYIRHQPSVRENVVTGLVLTVAAVLAFAVGVAHWHRGHAHIFFFSGLARSVGFTLTNCTVVIVAAVSTAILGVVAAWLFRSAARISKP